MKTFILLPALLCSLAAYSQPPGAMTSEQLKITGVTNNKVFLENRLASLEYNVRTSPDVWICVYTMPEEGTLRDTLTITVNNRTFSIQAKEITTEQRAVEIDDDTETSTTDYTTAQTTHSAASTSTTATQVNPDGTQSTVYYNGDTKLVVNPNGSHTAMPNNESSSTQVNPDGTHILNATKGTTTQVVNADGSHSTIHHNTPLQIRQPNAKTKRRHAKPLVPLHYSRIHVEGTPELLAQIANSPTLTLEITLSKQTIAMAMFTRPLQRYQKKLAAAGRTEKK